MAGKPQKRVLRVLYGTPPLLYMYVRLPGPIDK